ncbi:MAG: hypothetical protein IPJ41_05455 [Phycisphaerales bacterium]|nr:hypothetical protein [Phycisphaerales bacterium]
MDESGRAATEAGRVVEEAFLSPRVVDSATLAEFAESLGELLRRAAEQREHLRRTVAEGESVASNLRDATSQATEKLRPAAKLMPALEQRLSQAEQLIKTAGDAAGTLERTVFDAAKAASGEGLAAAQAAQRAIEQSLERARDVEARLGQLAQRADMAVELLNAECRQRLESAASHAQDVLGTMIAEIDTRADGAVARITSLIEERQAAAEAAMAEPLSLGGSSDGPADSATVQAHDIGPEIERLTEELRPRLTTEIAAGVRKEIDGLIDSVREQVGQRGRYLDERSRALDERAQRIEARATEAVELATAAEARLEAVRRELALTDERGREIAGAAGQALSAFDDELAQRMHAVREMMEQLASVTGTTAASNLPGGAAAPDEGPAHAPAATVESKPAREPGFMRIDRPLHGDTSAGLPGRLKF